MSVGVYTALYRVGIRVWVREVGGLELGLRVIGPSVTVRDSARARVSTGLVVDRLHCATSLGVGAIRGARHRQCESEALLHEHACG